MDSNGFLRVPKGSIRVPMDSNGLQWTPMDSNGFQRARELLDSFLEVFTGTHWSPLEPSGALWNPLEPSGTLWNPLEPLEWPLDSQKSPAGAQKEEEKEEEGEEEEGEGRERDSKHSFHILFTHKFQKIRASPAGPN